MTYEECLVKIHSYDKFGKGTSLDRVHHLLDELDHPEKNLKVIHVAGTNGKGSCCRYLYRMLLEAGYHVGLYTSPYLMNFTERIEYDGAEISHLDLIEATQKVCQKADLLEQKGFEKPTEFDVTFESSGSSRRFARSLSAGSSSCQARLTRPSNQ